MKSLRFGISWVVAIGTILIFSDNIFALYKVIEFREAIHSQREYALIIGLFAAVAVSSSLVLIPLAFNAGNFGRAAMIASRCWLAAAICAMTVLLMNGANLSEWSTRALEGRNYSAAWCLLVSIICLITTPLKRSSVSSKSANARAEDSP